MFSAYPVQKLLLLPSHAPSCMLCAGRQMWGLEPCFAAQLVSSILPILPGLAREVIGMVLWFVALWFQILPNMGQTVPLYMVTLSSHTH